MNAAFRQAMSDGRRVFHDRETNTVRLNPENYCLAAINPNTGHWFANVDAMCSVPPACIRDWLAQTNNTNGDDIALMLEDCLTL